MSETATAFFDEAARGNWIRLRTLVVVRWFAIAGQTAALTVAYGYFGLQLEIWWCALAILISVMANLLAMALQPNNRRLQEGEAALMLAFDLCQLAFLLALVGGLHNPFSLLILAPVTIAATALSTRYTVLLGVTAVVLTTLVALFHLPITWGDGSILMMPPIFVFGYWIAILTGIVFIAVYTRRVTAEMNSMSEALLATQMALAREQKLTDLGGVVAATAHELGTPLATIKLVSGELMEELSATPELLEDATLIREQADRCRDILKSMGRAGKDDLHMQRAPFEAVVREAAEPHINRGKHVEFDAFGNEDTPLAHPIIRRRPEVIHGIRNLIQNAVDFAQSEVFVTIDWSDSELFLIIRDDGPGFPTHVISRLGDPFVQFRTRKPRRKLRPEYEGMGLGVFIAKTLLERSGANIIFANNAELFPNDPSEDQAGANIRVVWPRSQLEAPDAQGENLPIH